jgi:predicted nucleotidyltransferase
MESPIPQAASLRAWARERHARLLVLFGSAATSGGRGPASDLDIAVEFSQVPPPDERLEVVRELQAVVDPRRVDVVFLRRDLDPVLRFEIFRSGRLLHEAEEGLMVRERVRALKEYQDALPFRRLLVDHLNRMAREGTLVP